jgi:hypothetical protein
MCMCVLTRCLLGLVASSQFNALRPVRGDALEHTGTSRKIDRIYVASQDFFILVYAHDREGLGFSK